MNHNSHIQALTFRPDGKSVAVATLKGDIYVWDVKQAQVEGVIECARDINTIRE